MRIFSLIFALFSGLLLYGTPLPAHGAASDARLIASGETGVTLELTSPSPTIGQMEIAGRSYSRVTVPGWGTTNQAGFPELPVTGTLIEVPRTGDIRVEITESTPYRVSGVDLYRIPPLKAPGPGLDAAEGAVDESLPVNSGPYPAEAVRIERIGIMRGVPVARILFYPFQWNDATKELLCRGTITVRVAFEDRLSGQYVPPLAVVPDGREEPAPQDPYGNLFRGTVINYRPLNEPGVRSEDSSARVRRSEIGEGAEVKAFNDTGRVHPLESAGISGYASGVRITVDHEGIYRVAYNDLKKAVPKGQTINPDTLRLFRGGTEVAVSIFSKVQSQFRSGSYIDFYAAAPNNQFTDWDTYFLVWGSSAGKRMSDLDGTVSGQGAQQLSFRSRLHAEVNLEFWLDMPSAPQEDYWFWEKITAPATRTFDITVLSTATPTDGATLSVGFRGVSTASPHPDHHTRLSLNGTSLSDERWDGTSALVQTAEIPQGLLKNGNNALVVDLPGDTGAPIDSIYLDWIEVTYQRLFEAINNELGFAVQGEGKVRINVTNLSTGKVQVYDITDPDNVRIVKNWMATRQDKAYSVTFEDDVVGEKKYFVTGNKAVKASTVVAWNPVGLRSISFGADYIIITPKEFLSAVSPLRVFREKQGLRAVAVPVEDIYDLFGSGVMDPKAIKDFLTYAYENWVRPAPTYVLLVGDASFDYKNNFNGKKKNRVPAHLSVTEQMGLTPDDNWYVTVEGDDVLPDMIIGRIPASTGKAVSDAVKKVLAYEKPSTYDPAEALFVADYGDPAFETLSEGFISSLPEDVLPHRVYFGSYLDDLTKATRAITAAINEGMLLTTYVGHGAAPLWSAEVFNSQDVTRLSNGSKLTFLLTLDCLNGFFAHPSDYSIAETFVTTKKGGAIAALSPSGLAAVSDFGLVGNAIFSSIFDDGNRVLGAVATGAKIAAFLKGGSGDMVRIFTFFGDPATRLKGGN